MTEHEGDIPESGAVSPGTTGRQLREAREAKGWDVQSLSENLHLRPSVLLAIESGHYQGVPELFLKGYVRSYARLLGLDGDRLMPQLEAELQPLRQEEAERVVHDPIFHIEARKRKKKRIAFWVLLLLLLCLVLFAVVRFQAAGTDALDFDESAEGETDPIAIAEDVFEGEEPRSIELVTEGSSSPASAIDTGAGEDSAMAENPALVPDTVVPDTVVSEEQAPGVREPLAEQPQTNNQQEAVAPVSDGGDLATESASLANEPVADVEPPGVAASSADIEFEIEFEGDCWIEIRNGAGQRVYAALKTAGETLSLSAVPPVSFVIGNVGAIESFSFGEEQVDVAGYRAWNGRAEITLGTDSGN
ncbi:MAG: hypothetical protein CL583_07895 [Alteromonadaceae bacterium]|nr:hypothetical protein [Alteromonadaceae bacterium]